MARQKDPGLGTSFSNQVLRFIKSDGGFNVIRKGGRTGIRDLFKFFIDINWLSFFLLLFAIYLVQNFVFALIYLLIGIEYLTGTNPELPDLFNAFFFSIQTFTTVGYGAVSPSGVASSLVASFEAFVGLLSFSIATGLLYGRFSKPNSMIRYSSNIIFTPFEEGMAVMFKMVNERNNTLLNTKVKATLILDQNNEDVFGKNYFNLKLETDFVNFFPLSWTLVHKITDESPLHNLSFKDLKQRNAEVVILVESFDETHSQSVLSKNSYGGEQWKEKVKFARNFEATDSGEIVLHVNKIDELVNL